MEFHLTLIKTRTRKIIGEDNSRRRHLHSNICYLDFKIVRKVVSQFFHRVTGWIFFWSLPLRRVSGRDLNSSFWSPSKPTIISDGYLVFASHIAWWTDYIVRCKFLCPLSTSSCTSVFLAASSLFLVFVSHQWSKHLMNVRWLLILAGDEFSTAPTCLNDLHLSQGFTFSCRGCLNRTPTPLPGPSLAKCLKDYP